MLETEKCTMSNNDEMTTEVFKPSDGFFKGAFSEQTVCRHHLVISCCPSVKDFITTPYNLSVEEWDHLYRIWCLSFEPRSLEIGFLEDTSAIPPSYFAHTSFRHVVAQCDKVREENSKMLVARSGRSSQKKTYCNVHEFRPELVLV